MEHKCSCGGHHDHHHHEHSCGGGCSCHKPLEITDLKQEEKDLLQLIKDKKEIPVVRFLATSSKEHSFVVSLLEPVYLISGDESMEEIKAKSEIFKKLWDNYFIEIEYEEEVEHLNYDVYENSASYKYFLETIEEAKSFPNFLGDTAVMEKGKAFIA